MLKSYVSDVGNNVKNLAWCLDQMTLFVITLWDIFDSKHFLPLHTHTALNQ